MNAVCPGPVGDTGIMDRNLAEAPDPAAALDSYLAKAPLAAAWGRLIEPARGRRADPLPVLRRGRDDHGRLDRDRRRQERRRPGLTGGLTGRSVRLRQNGGGAGGVTTSPCGWTVWRRCGVRRASSSSLGR